MENLKKIAVMIDADNTQLSKLEAVLQEVSSHGRIVARRAYGNWKKDTLKNWEDDLKRLAIKAVQQFDYTAGKNATDMALVIDCISLMHRGIYDAFVIVSSDSDFTPLAVYLRESGVYVMGAGNKQTPLAFRNSCDEFVFLENLEAVQETDESSVGQETAGAAQTATTAIQASSQPIVTLLPSYRKQAAGSKNSGSKDKEKDKDKMASRKSGDNINFIHKLLRVASDQYADDSNGYTSLGQAGNYIKRVRPDFDVRTYGYKKLVLMLEAFPKKYKIKMINKGVYYRCL